jgi:hypothetical protein
MEQIWPDHITPSLAHPRLADAISWIPGAVAQQVPMAAKLLPLGNCYWNVEAQVRKGKGGIQFGWLVLHWPDVYMVVMHHAVLRKQDGTLLDVTEKYPTDTVKGHSIFVPEDDAAVELDKPVSIPPRYLPLDSSEEVIKLAHVQRRKTEWERGRAAFNYHLGYRNEESFARAGIKTAAFAWPELDDEQYKQHAVLSDAIHGASCLAGDLVNLIRAKARPLKA